MRYQTTDVTAHCCTVHCIFFEFTRAARNRREGPGRTPGAGAPPQQVVNWRMVVFQIVDFYFVANLQLELKPERRGSLSEALASTLRPSLVVGGL